MSINDLAYQRLKKCSRFSILSRTALAVQIVFD
uniref:Uncharacterized protein n=1 Tax=Anguilla anguilla TaxID=7936 RepID=A0A0E9SK15_ANGAN